MIRLRAQGCKSGTSLRWALAKHALGSAGLCLRYSEATSPFFIGYAHEAMARGAAVAGDRAGKAHHLAKAAHYLAQVTSDRDRALLRADLESLADE